MLVPRISKEDLKTRLESSDAPPLIVDVRLKYPYEHSTITLPGAIRLGPGVVLRNGLPRDRDIVLYDSDPADIVAEREAAALVREGFRAMVLEGGIAGWAAARFPVSQKSAPRLAAPVTGRAKG